MIQLDNEKLSDINKKIFASPIAFADLMLGVKLHKGQEEWENNSTKTINILRPGNRFGKTFVAAVKHGWHGMCKPLLNGKVMSVEEWRRIEYNTLNFGPTYELGRGALQVCRELFQGNMLVPVCPSCDLHRIGKKDKYIFTCDNCLMEFPEPQWRTNKSLLKDWAIIDDRADAQVMPFIEFKTGARMLGRSMSEMGVAFKMRKLAYVTGDECGDIPDIWIFTNNTLLMRVVDFGGQIDLVGTPQPEGHDYMTMIEMAEEDMSKPDWKKNGMFYTQKGTTYENVSLPRRAIEEIEKIADPVMREQIIRGEHVETGEKYFGHKRIQNAVLKDIELLEFALPGRKYITVADYAGGESVWADYTVIMVIDYTDEPYKIVYFNRFKGGDMPIPMQYSLTEDVTMRFGGKGKLIIDSSALGGKNAMAFLGHLNPISAEYGPTKSSTLKANMLATLKIAFDGGQSETRKRIREKNEQGDWADRTMDWGLIRFSEILPLINELQNYKMDDTKLRTDCVMTLAMGIHWIEMRRVKQTRKIAIDFDFLGV